MNTDDPNPCLSVVPTLTYRFISSSDLWRYFGIAVLGPQILPLDLIPVSVFFLTPETTYFLSLILFLSFLLSIFQHIPRKFLKIPQFLGQVFFQDSQVHSSYMWTSTFLNPAAGANFSAKPFGRTECFPRTRKTLS